MTTTPAPSTPQHAIVTALGADRPGLVEELSRFIFERGGNIEESRMVNLGGQFAMMVLVAGAAEAMHKIQLELGPFAHRSGLHAEVRPADGASGPAGRAGDSAGAMPYRLIATALDQSGLVHRLSHLLRTLGVNIENLETHLTAAPYTGAATFEVEMAMAVPAQIPIRSVREQLGKLCDELNIDWQMTAL